LKVLKSRSETAEFSVVSTAESALKKLKKAEIAVFDCKKRGAEFVFKVNRQDVEKVFAIFGKACYNIRTLKKPLSERIISFFKLRAGLVAGVLAFVAIAFVSNNFVLKIEVSGSGKYLESEVRKIVLDEGAGEFKPFSSLNVSVATGRILALPQVTFCNIEKRGSVLVVDVQTDEEHYGAADLKELKSDCNGTVKNIVAICGTAAVAAGDSVKKGDVLIYAHMLAGEEQVKCIAAGYAEILCKDTREYFAAEDSEENLKNAYASLLIDEEDIVERGYKIKPTTDGIIYVMDFTYLHKLSINLS